MNTIPQNSSPTTVAPPWSLITFAEQNLGQLHQILDCSGPRENSRVWRVTAGRSNRNWYLKQHPSVKFHAREAAAYARWAPALGPGRAPELRAANPALSAIILSELPGMPVCGQNLSSQDEHEIHRQLGQLLSAFHRSAPQQRSPFTTPMLARVRRHVISAAPALAPGDARLVQHMAVRLAGLDPLPFVPTHGDVQLRNAIWNPSTRLLGLIDFERAEYGPAVRDLIRLEHGPWNGRGDLKAAFFTGFGAALTGRETKHLQPMVALDAISGIAFGLAAGDDEVVARGQRTLRRLRAEVAA